MTPAPRLEDAFERVLDHVRANLRPGPGRMFAGGKSMGGRIAANVAAKETGAGEQDLAGCWSFSPSAALLFLGWCTPHGRV